MMVIFFLLKWIWTILSQARSLTALIELFKIHKDEKSLKKTQAQLDHIKSKYNLTDSQLDQESQQIESDDDNDDDNVIGVSVADEDVMSDLTESGKLSFLRFQPLYKCWTHKLTDLFFNCTFIIDLLLLKDRSMPLRFPCSSLLIPQKAFKINKHAKHCQLCI